MVRLNEFQKGVIISLYKSGFKTKQILTRLRIQHRIEVSDRTVRYVCADYRKRGLRPKPEGGDEKKAAQSLRSV